jgi:methylphosphotriester-DNA--protein-cysteine methyltransferase
MIEWLTAPNNQDVAKYIECYWFLKKKRGTEGYDHPKLNPEPSTHLILQPDSTIYRYLSDDGISKGSGSHWLYPYNKTITLDHSAGINCIGIKFRVGALYSLKASFRASLANPSALPLSDTEYIQSTIGKVQAANLASLSGAANLNTEALIEAAKINPSKCCEALDELFITWLSNSYDDNHSENVRQVLPLLANTPINELGASLSCSQRTLERSFLRVTGLTLKQCQSMNKLESILEFLYQRKQSDIDWVDLAYQFGFSDQPHFIRYLKKQIGLTPKNYAEQRGFTIDVYGGVKSN